MKTCGATSPDHIEVCMLTEDHEGRHSWERNDD